MLYSGFAFSKQKKKFKLEMKTIMVIFYKCRRRSIHFEFEVSLLL